MEKPLLDRGDCLMLLIASCVVATSALHLLRCRRLRAELPYPPGHYLFPLDVIDASCGILRVYTLNAETKITALHQHKNGSYQFSSIVLEFSARGFAFRINGMDKANAALADFNAERTRMLAATQRGDWQTLDRCDPLFEVRSGNRWDWLAQPPASPPSRDEPYIAGPATFVVRPIRMAALLAGCLLGFAVWGLENIRRDNANFREAREAGNGDGFRDYLKDAILHGKEVRDELLPAAVFNEARNRGSVPAIRQYLRTFPTHRQVPEARVAIHGLYEQALGRMREHASSDAVGFLRPMFAWLEAHESPNVKVRFGRPTASALADAERDILANRGQVEGIDVAPISPSFSDERCQTREGAIVKTLTFGFRQIVKEEILTLSAGPRMSGANDEFIAPTLAIEYTILPSGRVYTDEGKKRGFVGISIVFSMTFISPGVEPLRFNLEVVPPEKFVVQFTKTSRADSSTPSDATVYDVMANEAFRKLDGKLASVFFSRP